MRPSHPANLGVIAARDLAAILERSASNFGTAHAERFRARIYVKCHEIAEGLNLGHLRQDVKMIRPARFIVIHPIVIAYDPMTRQILRILDGRRDLTSLLR